jgi:hypothetical protein
VTCLRVFPYSCPDKRREVAGLLAGYVTLNDAYPGCGEHSGPAEVDTGGEYTSQSAPAGAARELAGRLVATAPAMSFLLREDPEGESPGHLEAYIPLLGRFSGPCDQDGNVVLSHAALTIRTDGARRIAEMRSAVELAYGLPWLRDADKARKAAPPRQPGPMAGWLAALALTTGGTTP